MTFNPGPQQITVPDLSYAKREAAARQALQQAEPVAMDVQIRWNFPFLQEKIFRNVKIGSDPRLAMIVLEDLDGSGAHFIHPANVLWMHVAPARGEESWDAAE